MNEEQEYSLKDLYLIMRRKLWLIILLFVLGACTAFCIAKFVLPLKYQSYTTMYVKNNNSAQVGSSVNINDLNASKSLVSTYIAVLQSDSIMKEAGDLLMEEFGMARLSNVFGLKEGILSAGVLRDCLTMNSVNGTEVLKISAETTDAEISAALCRTISKLAPDFLIRVVGAGSVETIDEAQVRTVPVSPSIPKLTVMGAAVGAVLAVLLIFLLDFFDNTAKDAKKLAERYDKPLLGKIYNINDAKKNENDRVMITDKNTPFFVTESYKEIRSNLMFSLSTVEKKIVAVSSAMPGEGKSTTATNIAIAFSQLGDKKVLIIDADMRKPVQHKAFKIKNKAGLSTLLAKMKKTEECIQKNVLPNLDVITAGENPPNPAELLNSAQMEKALLELSELYDYIILDMPPVNVVSDPLSISRLVAGLVVVVRYGITTFDDVDELIKKAEIANMKLFGFVMTRIRQRAGENSYYHKKYYKYDYGYGNSGGVETPPENPQKASKKERRNR